MTDNDNDNDSSAGILPYLIGRKLLQLTPSDTNKNPALLIAKYRD